MTTPNPLEAYTAAADAGASFRATKIPGLAILTPLTPAADRWLHQHVGEESTWLADGLAVELRYFPDLADAIIAAGFVFERKAYPN